MPTLEQTLNGYDLDLLKIIAEKWGLTTQLTTREALITKMVTFSEESGYFQHIESGISEDARNCLSGVRQAGGKVPKGLFIRKYGELREMGVARRAREKPYASPISITEELWYMGLIGRAFLNEEQGLQEYFYIPDSWNRWIPSGRDDEMDLTALVADPIQYRISIPVDDSILDHLTSYLIALRTGDSPNDLYSEIQDPSLEECKSLLFAVGLLDGQEAVDSDRIRHFLSQPRNKALYELYAAWLENALFNDLKYVPDLRLEGTWRNDPVKTRNVLVEQIRNMDDGEWRSIDKYIDFVKKTQPDYQRPSGDYDSWIIASKKTGESLRGFKHWMEVDGALIRHFICGPLHWLGLVELGSSQRGREPESFRLSAWAADMLAFKPPEWIARVEGHITVVRNGRVSCPRNVPRAIRYQLARFCIRCEPDIKGYHYLINHNSLLRATDHGLQVEQLLGLLQKHCTGSVPTSLVKALKRWERNGVQVSLSNVVLLKFSDPGALEEIRKSNLGRFLSEVLNTTSATIPASAADKLVPRLLEMGYFCEYQSNQRSINGKEK